MSRRQDLEHHRHSLGEIREIMNSMKTLAYMETRKLVHFIDTQHTVVESIRNVAADFLSFHPETLPMTGHATPAFVLVGTERGFCGDFNQSLVRYLDTTAQVDKDARPMLIAVGRKLHTLLDNDKRVAVLMEGASVVEEITIVLNRLVQELLALQERSGLLTVQGLYHDSNGNIVMQKLLPPFQEELQQPASFPCPPLLNQSPASFLIELTEQYLFAALHEMLYTSLMAENHNRVSHLEGAVKHLDEESADLARKCNALRQEEIIEEIEVILLSASGLA